MRDRYAALGVTVMPRLGYNNTFAILVRKADADRLGLKTIGDLNTLPNARAGFGYEFLERPDGFKGLSAAYGLRIAGQPRIMDLNLIYRAVASNEIDVTAGDATSGQIDSLDLAVLEDDRHYFPAYEAVPVVRAATLLQISTGGGGAAQARGRDFRRRHAADELRRGRRETGPVPGGARVP